ADAGRADPRRHRLRRAGRAAGALRPGARAGRRWRTDPRQLLGRVRGRHRWLYRACPRRHPGAFAAARSRPPDRAAAGTARRGAYRRHRLCRRGRRGLRAAGPARRRPARGRARARVGRHGRLGLHLPPRLRAGLRRARRRRRLGLAARARAGGRRRRLAAPRRRGLAFRFRRQRRPRTTPVKPRIALLAVAIAGALAFVAGCRREAAPDAAAPGAASRAPAGETADEFVARVNKEVRELSTELNSAQWLSSTYINSDSERVASKANERWLAQLNAWIEQSRRFEGQQLSPETARALKLIKLWTAMPAPRDPAKLAELAGIATRMEGMYGAGSYCTGEGDARNCRDIGQLSEVLAKSRDYDAQLDAWRGWHTISPPMRKDYRRFVELVNE